MSRVMVVSVVEMRDLGDRSREIEEMETPFSLGEEPGISGAAGELLDTFSILESVVVGGRAGSAFLGAVALGSADIVVACFGCGRRRSVGLGQEQLSRRCECWL